MLKTIATRGIASDGLTGCVALTPRASNSFVSNMSQVPEGYLREAGQARTKDRNALDWSIAQAG
jgi:hypothetical protein